MNPKSMARAAGEDGEGGNGSVSKTEVGKDDGALNFMKRYETEEGGTIYEGEALSDDCFPVAYQIRTPVGVVNSSLLIVAILSGALLGLVLALGAVQCCLKRRWLRDKRKKSTLKKDPRLTMLWLQNCCKKKSESDIPHERLLGTPDSTLGLTSGELANRQNYLAEAMMADSSEAIEIALANQSIQTLEQLDEDLLNKRVELSKGATIVSLNEIPGIGKDSKKALIEEIFNELRQKISAEHAKHLDEWNKLKIDYGIEPKTEAKLDEIKAKFLGDLHRNFNEALKQLESKLKLQPGISEDELENLMKNAKQNVGQIEELLAEHLAAELKNLHDKELDRLGMIEENRVKEGDVEKDLSDEEEAIRRTWNRCVDEGLLSGSARDALMKEFKKLMQDAKEKHAAALKAQLEQLGGKLYKENAAKVDLLKQKHQKEWNELGAEALVMKDPTDYIEQAARMITKQREELNTTSDENDAEFAEKLNSAKQKIDNSFRDAMKSAGQRLLNDAAGQIKQNRLPSGIANAARHLIDRYHAELNELEKVRGMDKQMQLQAVRQKIDRLKKKKQQIDLQDVIQDQKFNESQDRLLERVIGTQLSLDDGAKQQIIGEHHRQQKSLHSNMTLLKNYQDKRLDKTIASRKLLLAKEKQKKLDKFIGKNGTNIKNREQILRNFEIEYKNELSKIEADKCAKVQENKERLAKEIQQALLENETNLAELIGRLQLGCYRRQTIIDRQSKMIKKLQFLHKLQDVMKDKMSSLSRNVNPEDVGELLKSHHNEVVKLNAKLDSTRERQLSALQQKLESKRMEKRRIIENKYEEKEEDMLSRSMRGRISFAASMLCQEQIAAHQQRALQTLESEMNIQLHREKDALNRQLKTELEDALLTQRKHFLRQLADLCKLSSEELKEVTNKAREERRKSSLRRKSVSNINETGPTSPDDFSHNGQLNIFGQLPDSLPLTHPSRVPDENTSPHFYTDNPVSGSSSHDKGPNVFTASGIDAAGTSAGLPPLPAGHNLIGNTLPPLSLKSHGHAGEAEFETVEKKKKAKRKHKRINLSK